MVINEHIRELILNKESASVIGEAAKAAGMSTLHDAGVKKVLAGVTTIEELMRVTFREGEI
jgi:type II secretory ATPase GspE/PulE/Tfp pilus assembly ATPase PilB-like protein